jgi:hypothetical protein
MLRNKEQLDIVLKSKAYAKLTAMPIVKKGLDELAESWNDPNGPLAPLQDWYSMPGNADIVAMVGELFSDEVFFYADKNCAEIGALYQDVYWGNQINSITELIKNGPLGLGLNNDPFASYKSMLYILSEHSDKLKVPDFVIGFKLSKTNPTKLAKMIDDGLKIVDFIAPPGVLKKETINGSKVHTVNLDGSMIPWEMIPIAQLEEQPGQLDKLKKRLTKMKLTISVSVRDNYLLLGVGEATAGLKALSGKGKLLIDQKELAPLVKFGKERLTSISYASKEYMTVGTETKMDEALKDVNDLLKETNLTPAQKTKIQKDVKGLLEDVKRWTPEPGAQLAFDFLNGRGYEGYRHDWTKYTDFDSSKPLTILEHVGGKPIAFVASRSPSQQPAYDSFIKYVKLAHGYFEEYALPEITPDQRATYRKIMDQALPQLARLDKATSKMLLPSLDGQGAWVLDAKLKIDLPNIAKPMPVPELGIVAGLSDATLFKQAMSEYREAFNALVDIAVKFAPPGADVPDFKIPDPQIKKGKKKGPTFYSWPLPKVPGLDPKILPTAGVTQNLAVFGLSQSHAARLLAKNPFKTDGGPLGDITKPLASAAYFDWAGLVDAAGPWIDLGIDSSGPPQEVVDQIRTGVEILKVLRSISSATYLEQGAVVTHHETIIRDLEK